MQRRTLWISAATAAVLVALAAVLVAFALASSDSQKAAQGKYEPGVRKVSKAQYERTVRASWGRVRRAFLATKVRRGLAARVAAAQAELRRAAETLDAIEAPPAVSHLNDQLVEGLRGYADELDVVREAAERNERGRIAAFNAKVAASVPVSLIAEAAEEMRYKGYNLGPIASD